MRLGAIYWKTGVSPLAFSRGAITDASYIPVAAVTAPVLARTGTAGATPVTFTTTLNNSNTYVGDFIRFQVASDSSFSTVTQDISHQYAEADKVNADINLTADGFVQPTGTYWLRARVERDDGTTSAWSNVLTETIGSTWTPSTAVAQDNGFASLSATFTGIPFIVGDGIVAVFNKNRVTSALTIGGVSAALVKQSGTTSPHVSMWQAAVASAGNKTVVATAPDFAIGEIAIACGTKTGISSTVASTASLAYGYGADPQTTGSVTFPSGGLILAAVGSENGGNTATWTVGTKDSQASTANALISLAHLSATGAPTATGFDAVKGAGMVAAAWGP